MGDRWSRLRGAVRRAAVWTVALLICGATLAAPAPWRDKVHPGVLDRSVEGPVEFLVVLDEQAELDPARAGSSKLERGRYVFETLRDTATRSQAPLIAWLERQGLEYRAYWIANMIRVRGDRAAVEHLARRSRVRRIDANPRIAFEDPARVTSGDEPAPALRAIEWSLQHVAADLLWALGYDGANVVVGGTDTGYDWDHPALKDRYRGWNGSTATHDYNWHDAVHSGSGSCGADSPEPCDDHNHGTHTMGTMVGDDGGANRIGMAPGARWIGCRNMDQGVGTPATYTECLQWFVAPTDLAGLNPDPSQAPAVINNSWACPSFEGCAFDTLRTAIENVRSAGIVVVASAGNGGSGCETVANPPAIYEASFSVGATDASDEAAGFSSRGPVTVDGSGRTKPDIAAPGVGIRSSIRDGAYASFNGTSMAAPHVVGLVALLLDARPDLSGRVDEIETILRTAAVPLTTTQDCGSVLGTETPNNTFGSGRIDALETLFGDADGDGVDNLGDCSPVAATVWSAPEDVLLTLDAGTPSRLVWSAPTAPGSDAPRYDVLRSTSPDDFSTATCLATDVASAPVEDGTPPGSILYYLVRIENECGDRTGSASDGAPRQTLACGP